MTVSSSMLNDFGTMMHNAISLVWLELVMLGLAVVMYFVFNGATIFKKTNKKGDDHDDDRVDQDSSEMFQTQHHRKDYAAAVKAWREAKVDPKAAVCLPTA